MTAVVVTGASGHVGANLVRALLASGRNVRALVHRDRRALEGLDIEMVPGDVTDIDSLRCAFLGADNVYHTAAHISITTREWQRLEAVNIFGTANVVEACLRCGVHRLVHFSSIEALVSEPNHTPVDESRPLVDSPRCPPYARSKAAGERLVRQGLARGLDAITLYPTAMLGPHDYRMGFPNSGLLALCRGEWPALIDGGFDWVDVRDVARGALRAAEVAQAGGRYILSGHWASLRDLAELAEETTGTRVPSLIAPMWLARLGAPIVAALSRFSGRRPLYTSAALYALGGNPRITHRLAAQDLGYLPRSLKEIVNDTLEWFRTREQEKE